MIVCCVALRVSDRQVCILQETEKMLFSHIHNSIMPKQNYTIFAVENPLE